MIINESISEEERIKSITNPKDKKLAIAVCDIIVEYAGFFTGDRNQDNRIIRDFNNFIEKGDMRSLYRVADKFYELTGNTEFKH